MAELSIIIPARNEMWVGHTVRDVLEHTSDATEVIVVLDGAWPETPLPLHPRLQVVYLPESIGQRAATNLGARISTAKYICKLDAHCSVEPGFDRVLLDSAAELGDDVTQIPMQDNLHVFDWVCDGCGKRRDQGPTPTECDHCKGTAHHRDVVWTRRRGVRTTSWRFDSDLKFGYWGDYSHRPEAKATYPETMSCLGACWFINRARFLSWGGLDERHGSWGQMGTEISCASWLSGGRMVCNTKTTFAHLFRTQGGFGFPYPISGRQVEGARQYSQNLWLDDQWPWQVRPLLWLVEKFSPVPGWSDINSRAFRRARKSAYAFGVVLTAPGSMADGAATVPINSGRQLVPEMAMSSSGTVSGEPDPSQDVVSVRQQPQVDRVAAVSAVADVIEHGDVCAETDRDRLNSPRVHDAVDSVADFFNSDAAVSGGLGPEPQPAVGQRVALDLGEQATDPESVQVRDREKLLVSHASASRADVRLGVASRSQRFATPPIIPVGLVYYSDCLPEPWLLEACRAQLREAAGDLPLVSVTLQPVPGFGQNIVLDKARGVLTMFEQILAGLEALDTDVAFLVEHDVLYSPTHFAFRPSDPRTYYYNQNAWRVDAETGRALFYYCNQTSGLCADRELLVNHYRARVAHVQQYGFSRRNGFEPGTRQVRHGGFDDYSHATWMSEQPNIDIRHGHNLTASRWSRDQFRNKKYCQGWTEADVIPGWGQTAGRFRAFLDEHVGAALTV